VSVGTLLASLLLLALAFFGPRRLRGRGSAVDLCAAMLATTMASPIAWEHHYGVLLPIGAVLLAALWTRRRALAALAVAWLAAAHYFPATESLALPLGIVQSYLLFAALGMLALLLSRQALPDPAPH
jgi:hypothetical protein